MSLVEFVCTLNIIIKIWWWIYPIIVEDIFGGI